MLVVRVEIWPGGDESRKRDLGTAAIANNGARSDATGGEEGNYDFRLFKSPQYAKRPGVWKKGSISGFPRQRLGPWDLLFRVLLAAVGDRNRDAVRNHNLKHVHRQLGESIARRKGSRY